MYANAFFYIFFIITSKFTKYEKPCPSSVTTNSGTHAGKVCSGQLIFEENFDNFDLSVWEHERTLTGGGNYEFQYYLNNRSNSYVKNDILHIKPTLLADEYGEEFLSSGTLVVDQCTNSYRNGCNKTGTPEKIINPIKSARIRTIKSFAFKYGKVEVRAKTPVGDWLWPAIWLMPKASHYSSWPVSGEIDMMESRGNRDLIDIKTGENIGSKLIGSTLHFGPNSTYNRYRYTHYEATSPEGFNARFHKYQLIWTPDNITFFLDDKVIGFVQPTDGGFWEYGELNKIDGLVNPWRYGTKMAPFDQEFYIILNLACGGLSYFPDTATNPGGKPWPNNDLNGVTNFWKDRYQWLYTWVEDSSYHFQVDYVRVWAL